MLDIFFLFSVSGGFFQGSDDKGRGRGDNRDCSLSVLNGEFHRHT